MSTEPRAPAPPRPPLDGRALAELARGGGELALAAWRSTHGSQVWPRKGEQAVSAWLARELKRLAPDVGVFGPGARSASSASREWQLAVQPLDGPDAFIARIPTWGISLGLLHGGDLVSGAVYLPAIADLYVADAGELRWNERLVPKSGQAPGEDGLVLVGADLRRRAVLRLGRGRGGPVGAISYHLCLVARGAAQAAVVPRAHLWEIAGGLAVLEAAGGELVYPRSGRRVHAADLIDGGRTTAISVAALPAARERALGSLRVR